MAIKLRELWDVWKQPLTLKSLRMFTGDNVCHHRCSFSIQRWWEDSRTERGFFFMMVN